MMVSIRLIQYNMPLLKESARQSARVLFYSYPSSKSRRRKRTRALGMLFPLDKRSIFYSRELDITKPWQYFDHQVQPHRSSNFLARRRDCVKLSFFFFRHDPPTVLKRPNLTPVDIW